jgi:hypothetical protein
LNRPGAGRSAIAAGVILAGLAALTFGATAPFIRMTGAGVGPSLTASLLYGGALLGALPNPWGRSNRAPRMTRAHLPRLVLVAILGAAIALRSKAAMGASLTLWLGLALGESRPGLRSAIGLLLCGMTGYGISLRLYLLAQRRIGAARTGSVFAIAPFVGAALALGFERHLPDWSTIISAGLFAFGVYLHGETDAVGKAAILALGLGERCGRLNPEQNVWGHPHARHAPSLIEGRQGREAVATPSSCIDRHARARRASAAAAWPSSRRASPG